MGEGVPGLAAAYEGLFTAALIFLAILLVLCLIRAIIGPRVADRLVAVNMMGTMVMVIIAILTLMLQEGYLADICLIYAMISFLAVVVLTKVYMGVYLARKEHREAEASTMLQADNSARESDRVSYIDMRKNADRNAEKNADENAAINVGRDADGNADRKERTDGGI
ncbi:MAG: cation:proton antiporter [Lachnospiraceae bacterium]|nr:cation:proton antiporter [Lachnospiraceae bacterium]